MSAKKTIPCTIDPLESLMTMRHFSKPLKKKPIKLRADLPAVEKWSEV